MKIFKCIVPLLICTTSFGQPGKDGSYTVTTANQVLNSYYPIISNISAGSTTLVLANTPLLCFGDLVVVYQAQGASLNSVNTSSYGAVSSFNSSGLYEFCFVSSINANTVTLQSAITNSYSTAGRIQLIKVPQYTNLVVNSGASISCKDWKDTAISSTSLRFGGLVVIHASTITNNGTITASGKGFRGGAQDLNSTFVTGITDYVSNSSNNGGEKGESICGFGSEYDNNGGRYCRGAPANGGGGGDAHNSAGGGGANGDNGNTWTGEGVMIVDANNPLAAWSLSSAYTANGNSVTNSSGGGHGGYSWGNTNQNALTVAPGNSLWQGDNRREVGGVGGRPLSNISSENRIYFGGGGGAAEANNSVSPGGGNGGGIVYLIASSINGSGLIAASGSSALSTFSSNNDGASGGGGGGSVVIKTASLASTQSVVAVGGNGANQYVPGPPGALTESDGPGGGGGGGFIAVPSGFLNYLVSGGQNGTTLSPSVTEFINNGATQGAIGQVAVVSSTIINFSPLQILSNNPICAGETVTLSPPALSGVTAYSWSGPNGFSATTSSVILNNISVAASGTYSFSASYASGCSASATVNVSVNVIPSLIISSSSSIICLSNSVALSATGASSYTWQPIGAQGQSVSVTPTVTTVYSVSGTSSLGCTSIATLQVDVSGSPILILTPASPTACSGLPLQLTVSGAGSYTWNPGALSGSIITINPAAATVYTVSGSSGPGCTSTETLAVQVSPTPTITASSSPTNVCAGGTATLTASGASNYTWLPGQSTGSLVVVSPQSSITYTVIGESNGCTSSFLIPITNTLNTTIAPQGNLDCQNSTIQLSLTSASASTSVLWSGPGIVGSMSGSIIYINTSGVYSATVTDLQTGCVSISTLAVLSTGSQLNLNIIPSNTAACFPGPAVNLLSMASANYSWYPPSLVSPSTGPYVSVSPSVTTTYTLIGMLGTCSGSTSITILVDPVPDNVAVSGNFVVCRGITTTISASGAGTYKWFPGDLSGSTVTLSPFISTTYTVTGANGNCTQAKTFSIEVNSAPQLAPVTSSIYMCAGDSKTITANGALSYTWQPGNIFTQDLIVTPIANIVYTLSGTNGFGCQSVSTLTINVGEKPLVAFEKDSIMLCQGSELVLNYSGASNYTLTPETLKPDSTTVYVLTGESNNCFGSDNLLVMVVRCDTSHIDDEFFIPQGFSPDGNGINDLFVIKGLHGRQVKLNVFNRWGQLVYKKDNYDNTWNGKPNVSGFLLGDGFLPEATYYFVLEFVNGEKSINGFVVVRHD